MKLNQKVAIGVLLVGVGVCAYGWGNAIIAQRKWSAAIERVRQNNDREVVDSAAVDAMFAAGSVANGWVIVGWLGLPVMLVGRLLAR